MRWFAGDGSGDRGVAKFDCQKCILQIGDKPLKGAISNADIKTKAVQKGGMISRVKARTETENNEQNRFAKIHS